MSCSPVRLRTRWPLAAVLLLAGSGWIEPRPGLLAADDLSVLRAAVEERLTSIATLEVHYRWAQKPTEKTPDELITDEMSVTWCWAGGRESF